MTSVRTSGRPTRSAHQPTCCPELVIVSLPVCGERSRPESSRRGNSGLLQTLHNSGGEVVLHRPSRVDGDHETRRENQWSSVTLTGVVVDLGVWDVLGRHSNRRDLAQVLDRLVGLPAVTEAMLAEMRVMRGSGLSHAILAEHFGVARRTLGRVL